MNVVCWTIDEEEVNRIITGEEGRGREKNRDRQTDKQTDKQEIISDFNKLID